jgi:hypothetical protein
MSKLADGIAPLKEKILSGTILAIDPSSGSRESMPGYCIFKNGQFVDSGIIRIKLGQLNNRLFQLRQALMDDFKDIQPDILVTENIPPVMLGQGKFVNRSMLSLQKSVGVVISCFDCPLIEVAPISWRKYIPENYVKSDEVDAIMMAITVMKVATDGAFEIEPRVLKRLAGAEWTA